MGLLSLDELKPNSNFMPTSGRLRFREWVDSVGILIRGKPYNTVGHEYLKQIINDDHPDQTFQKAAQVGISTVVVLKGLYVAEHLGRKTVYYFQDDGAVSDFSNDRATPIIEASPYLSTRVRSTNNVGLKQVGPGSIYFRGLYSKGKAKSVDADMICLDELDEAKEEHVEFALDRLLHSDLQWVHALSQPSFPGFGIDLRFALTDQQYWMIKCPKCGEHNCLELDFPANFIPISKNQSRSWPDGATHFRGCRKCQARLDMAVGEWVPKYPSRARRGYHLSHLYSQITVVNSPNFATKVMREYEEARRFQTRMARFTISEIGFPYSGGNARVTDELLDSIEGDYGFSLQEVGAFMGVDQGDVLTIAVAILSGGILRFVHFEETSDWGRLDLLMERFSVSKCIIDAQPNKHSAKSFVARYPKRASIQYFTGKELVLDTELHEGKILVDCVKVPRTDSLDSFIDKMEGGFVNLPNKNQSSGINLKSLEDVRRHLKSLISRLEQSSDGSLKRVYLRGESVENHYGMAMNSASIAAFDLGIHSPGPMVLPVWGGRTGNA